MIQCQQSVQLSSRIPRKNGIFSSVFVLYNLNESQSFDAFFLLLFEEKIALAQILRTLLPVCALSAAIEWYV